MAIYVYIIYAIHTETQITFVEEIYSDKEVADDYCATLNKENSTFHSYYVEKQVLR